jgi:hypothetical protein
VTLGERGGNLSGRSDTFDQGRARYMITIDTDQLGDTLRGGCQQFLYGGVTKDCTLVAVECAWNAAALDMAQHGQSRIFAEPIFKELPNTLAADRLPVAVSRALGHDNNALASSARPPGAQKFAYLIFPVIAQRWVLGDEHGTRACG